MSVFLASFLGEPLPVADYWLWLAFPICLAISVVYKTIKVERLRDIFPAAAILFGAMIGGLALVTIALWLLIQLWPIIH